MICELTKYCCLKLLWKKLGKLAKQLQIDVRNFSEMKKRQNMSVVLTLRLGIHVALPCATSIHFDNHTSCHEMHYNICIIMNAHGNKIEVELNF